MGALECFPRRGLRLDPVNDRLSGVNACGQSINVPPILVAMRGAIAAGGIAGDWATVRYLFADSGEHLPAGGKVLGSNGAVYKLVGDDNVDPTLDDGTNWVLLAPAIESMDAAAKAGGVLGDWQAVKDAYAKADKAIPVGALVLGSDGALYKLVGSPTTDPTKDDGTNWKVVAPTAAGLADEMARGGVLGDWKTVSDKLAEAGKKIPAGAVVLGSDGGLYKLIGNPAVDPTKDDGTNWSVMMPDSMAIEGAINAGGVAGEWLAVKDALAAAGKTMPPGIIVFGSNGSLYKLVGDPAVDPVTDKSGTHWINLTMNSSSYKELTF